MGGKERRLNDAGPEQRVVCDTNLGNGSFSSTPPSDPDGVALCRVTCIEMLQSKYPWVCSTDMILFLLGLEAAESIPSHILGI